MRLAARSCRLSSSRILHIINLHIFLLGFSCRPRCDISALRVSCHPLVSSISASSAPAVSPLDVQSVIDLLASVLFFTQLSSSSYPIPAAATPRQSRQSNIRFRLCILVPCSYSRSSSSWSPCSSSSMPYASIHSTSSCTNHQAESFSCSPSSKAAQANASPRTQPLIIRRRCPMLYRSPARAARRIVPIRPPRSYLSTYRMALPQALLVAASAPAYITGRGPWRLSLVPV